MAMSFAPFLLAELILPTLRDGSRPRLGWAERIVRALLPALGWSGTGAAIAALIDVHG